MYYPQLWISGHQVSADEKAESNALIWSVGLELLFLIFPFILLFIILDFTLVKNWFLLLLFLCFVQSWDFSEASCFLNFSSILTNYFHSISYLFFLPSTALFSPNSSQKSCPFSLFLGEGREGAGYRECSSTLCLPVFPFILFLSAPVKQKGEAQPMLPGPAAILGLLPRKRHLQTLLNFWEWVGWTGDSLSFSYPENYVVTMVFQWSVKSLHSKRFLHLNVKSNGSIHWVADVF